LLEIAVDNATQYCNRQIPHPDFFMYKLLIFLLFVPLVNVAMFGQDTVLQISADQKNQIHIVSKNGKTTVVAREPGQVGIDSVQIAEDGQTAGWLVLYENPDGGSPLAGTLVLWRSGKIMRHIQVSQTFWSWGFYARGEQVAYHVGPTHGETQSHCELHDVASGRFVTSWDGDLENTKRPPWTKVLDH
jgi:hypothetical protein